MVLFVDANAASDNSYMVALYVKLAKAGVDKSAVRTGDLTAIASEVAARNPDEAILWVSVDQNGSVLEDLLDYEDSPYPSNVVLHMVAYSPLAVAEVFVIASNLASIIRKLDQTSPDWIVSKRDGKYGLCREKEADGKTAYTTDYLTLEAFALEASVNESGIAGIASQWLCSQLLNI